MKMNCFILSLASIFLPAASVRVKIRLGAASPSASSNTSHIVSRKVLTTEIEEDTLAYPTNEEYDKFRNCVDLRADLKDIVAIGRKVFLHRDDPNWPEEVGMHTKAKKFLHPNYPEKSVLRERMKWRDYAGQKLKGSTIAIMGGGPSGLRLAIEVALHGAIVHVLEKRTKFNRFNVLKLWSFTKEDIESLGGKILYPKFSVYQVKRIPIAVLQHLLMRIALTLGVQVHPACAVKAMDRHDTTLTIDPKYECPTYAEFEHVDFDAIFDAAGTIGVLRDSTGEDDEPLIATKVVKHEVLGMTMNFKRFGMTDENAYYYATKDDPRFVKFNPAKTPEAHCAKQYFRKIFESKAIQIENWVYWKSDASHYIVVSIPRATLVDAGVAPNVQNTSELLRSVDRGKLVSLGLALAEEWNFPHKPHDASAFMVNAAGKPDLSVFDFGTTVTAKKACKFLQGRRGQNVYFGVVGDAITTPFWPDGTGANHAFYSSYLQTWALLAWKGYEYGVEGTSAAATKMMKAMLSMPVAGNRPGFKKREYEELVKTNYDAVAMGKIVKFY